MLASHDPGVYVSPKRVVTRKGIKGCTERTQRATWDSVVKGVGREELWTNESSKFVVVVHS